MNLYEALKKGTPEEDLKKTFEEELTKAREQLIKDNEAELALNGARKDAATALVKYFTCLFEDTDIKNLSTKTVLELLKEYEDVLADNINNLEDIFNDLFSSFEITTTSKRDGNKSSKREEEDTNEFPNIWKSFRFSL